MENENKALKDKAQKGKLDLSKFKGDTQELQKKHKEFENLIN